MLHKTTVLIIFFLGLGFQIKAQQTSTKSDKLFKADNTVIDCKIIEVSDLEIKYKKANYLDGPTYSIAKKEVVTILYANGESEVVNVNKSTQPTVTTPESNSTPTSSGNSNTASRPVNSGNSNRPIAVGTSLTSFYGNSSLFVEAGYLPTVKSDFISGSASGLEAKATFLVNNYIDSDVLSLISYGGTLGYGFASGRVSTGGDLTYTQIPIMGSFRAYFAKYVYLQADIGANITKAEFENLVTFEETQSSARLIYGINAGYVLGNFTFGLSYHLSSWKDLSDDSYSLNSLSIKVGYKF